MTTIRARLAVARPLKLLALVAALLAAQPSSAATLTVGPGQQYRTVAQAVAAARDGDVVQVRAGTYTNDFPPTVTRKISIVGVGGMARLVATVPPPNGKAILVTATDVTLDRLEFAGARVADRNGAGIRYEGGRLTIRRCYFRDNENGILGGSWPSGSVDIADSEFAWNGRGDGYTHGIYLGQIASLQVTSSYLHHTKVGHHIKSRAARTTVRNSRIVDGTGGTASYSIDLPNGGVAVISGNTIEQSATSQNYALIHFGGEGAPYAGSSLQVTGNVLQNWRSSAVGVLNQTSAAVSVTQNRLYRLPSLIAGPGAWSGNVTLASPVAISTSAPWRN